MLSQMPKNHSAALTGWCCGHGHRGRDDARDDAAARSLAANLCILIVQQLGAPQHPLSATLFRFLFVSERAQRSVTRHCPGVHPGQSAVFLLCASLTNDLPTRAIVQLPGTSQRLLIATTAVFHHFSSALKRQSRGASLPLAVAACSLLPASRRVPGPVAGVKQLMYSCLVALSTPTVASRHLSGRSIFAQYLSPGLQTRQIGCNLEVPQ